MFSLVIKSYYKIALLGQMHYKYIRCNSYSFSLCLNFHCNLTIRFTSNCCSDYSWIIVKLKNSLFTVTSTLDCITQLNVNCTARSQWKVDTTEKLYIFEVWTRLLNYHTFTTLIIILAQLHWRLHYFSFYLEVSVSLQIFWKKDTIIATVWAPL